MSAGRHDLRLLTGAVLLSALGDFLALVPLALHLQERTGSGTLVAALFIALWSPAIVLARPAGWLADRVESRRLLIVVSLASAGIAVALALSAAPAAILALAALLGAANAIAQPAEFALLPAAAGARGLQVANGRVESARYLGYTLGPLLGGVLAAGGGMRAALLVDAATFLVLAVAVWCMRARREPVAAAEPSERAHGGVADLLGDRVLGLVMPVAIASLLFMTASATAEVFFATEVLQIGELGYGLLLTAWTLGMVLGATALPPHVKPAAAATVALAAIAVQGSGLALPALWLALPFALAAYVVGGAAHGLKNVVIRTLVHERVPERHHGRAFASYNALRNGAELVALAGGGVLVATAGARWTLVVAGSVPLMAALLGLARVRRGRQAAASSPGSESSPTLSLRTTHAPAGSSGSV